MKRIVITGATSFIGKKLCHSLKNDQNQIYAVVRKASEQLNELDAQICATMDEYAKLDALLPMQMDVGILLAWSGTRGADRNNIQLQLENVAYSIECLKAMHRAGCKTIVFAGSQAQYGPKYGDAPTVETDETLPNTHYGKAKNAFSQYAQAYCKDHGLRYIEPRIFSIYGEGDFEGTLTMSLLKKLVANAPCDLTQCVQLWDYLYIDDAVKLISKLIEKETADGIFHIAAGDIRPLKDFVMQMYAITGSQSELRFGAIAYPATGIVNINPSVEKTKNTIGEFELTPFEVGIKNTLKSL